MKLSIVIPLLNEAESLPLLHKWIIKALEKETYKYEVLYIDDGSTDKSWNIISELAEAHPEVKGISFARNYGKSQALHAGFRAAQGNYVATLDADLQDSPEEIQKMMDRLTEEQLDLISGWKKVRHDAVLSKNIPSKMVGSVKSTSSKK